MKKSYFIIPCLFFVICVLIADASLAGGPGSDTSTSPDSPVGHWEGVIGWQQGGTSYEVIIDILPADHGYSVYMWNAFFTSKKKRAHVNVLYPRKTSDGCEFSFVLKTSQGSYTYEHIFHHRGEWPYIDLIMHTSAAKWESSRHDNGFGANCKGTLYRK